MLPRALLLICYFYRTCFHQVWLQSVYEASIYDGDLFNVEVIEHSQRNLGTYKHTVYFF